eukprot:3798367-Prymnesium_polylepis.1
MALASNELLGEMGRNGLKGEAEGRVGARSGVEAASQEFVLLDGAVEALETLVDRRCARHRMRDAGTA